MKNLGEHQDLHIRSNTLLLDDVLDNFKDICLEIYKLDPSKFLWAAGLSW